MSNILLNAGSGGATLGTDTVAGSPNTDYQIVKVGFSLAGSAPTQVSASNALPVAQTGALPAGANTIGAVTQASGPWTDNLTQIAGTAVDVNSGLKSAGTLRVVLATDQPSLSNALPVLQSGSWTVTANLGTLNGAALDASVTGLQVAQGSTTSGQKGSLALGAVTTGAPTYTTAQSSALSLTTAGALRVDNSAVTQPVSGTFWQATQPVSAASLPLPTGAATAAKQPALGTAGAASADVITVQGVASMTALKVDGSAVTQPVSGTFWQATQPVSGTVTTTPPANASSNVAQINAVTPLMGNGVTGTGSLRVTVASDNTAFTVNAAQSGTWTVQPGNTANTTPWLATNVPGTAPGSTRSRIKAAASTNSTNLKVSAGVVLGYALYNNTASAKAFKFYDKATAPTVGTDTPAFTVIIPASGGANIEFSSGIPFSTGIGYGITGATADADTTATAVDDVHGMVLWK